MNRNWLYTLSLTPGLIAIYGNLTGGVFAFGNFVFSLVFLAISEWITKDFLSNETTDQDDFIPKFILLPSYSISINVDSKFTLRNLHACFNRLFCGRCGFKHCIKFWYFGHYCIARIYSQKSKIRKNVR